MTASSITRRAVAWLSEHDPEYDWTARATEDPGADFVGAILDNLREFGTGDDEGQDIVREAIAIVHDAWRERVKATADRIASDVSQVRSARERVGGMGYSMPAWELSAATPSVLAYLDRVVRDLRGGR